MPATRNRKFLSRSNRLIISAALLLSIFAMTALCFARGRISGLLVSAAAFPISVPPKPLQDKATKNIIESEIVTVTPRGFEPLEITRPKGRFLLMVEDRSGINSLSLRLITTAGPTIREMPMVRESPDWSEVIDPSPGEYLLVDDAHPGWLCRITITP